MTDKIGTWEATQAAILQGFAVFDVALNSLGDTLPDGDGDSLMYIELSQNTILDPITTFQPGIFDGQQLTIVVQDGSGFTLNIPEGGNVRHASATARNVTERQGVNYFWDSTAACWRELPGGSSSGGTLPGPSFPSGPAGGALTGAYPNPTLAAVATATTAPYPASLTINNAGQVTSVSPGSTPVLATEKGVAGGVATLGGNSKIPVSQLPTGVLDFLGTWDANANTPALASGTGTSGDLYIVATAGSTALDGISTWGVGDFVVFTPLGVWEKITRDDAVLSVNGQTGTVQINVGNLGSGTLSQLNTAITDANLDSSSSSRPPSGAAGGALVGSFPDPDVAQIRTVDVAATNPTDLQSLVYDLANTQYSPRSTVISLGGLTGVITVEQLRDLLNPAVNVPAVSDFHITAPASVTPGTVLTGNAYSSTYQLVNAASLTAARLVGISSTGGSASVIEATASRVEGPNTQSWVFPSNGDFTTAGNIYTVRYEGYTAGQTVGSSTPAVQIDQSIVTQVGPRNDLLYWGTSATNTPGDIVVTGFDSQTQLDGDVTLPTWADSQYVVFAYPDSAPAVTQLLIGSVNQLAAFTATPAAITVDGVSYTVLISNNSILGSVASGSTATLTR